MTKRHWSVAEAKAKFSEVMARAADEGPQHIRRNGRNAAVLVSAEQWAKMKPRRTLIDIMADPSFSVLEREEVDALFARDNGPERSTPQF
jgi:prevent-host-death family protein